jgi:hypothetical protein
VHAGLTAGALAAALGSVLALADLVRASRRQPVMDERA